jgi:two-component system CheB/CheR fusion protein
MAFAVVQHLDPEHASELVSLLSRVTSMPVQEARAGALLAPNQVYVIPHNRDITVSGGRIQLSPVRRKGQPHMPIDALFHSLASNLGQRAIGVVLSGGGSDGALGLGAIKAAGGLAFAQEESSAKEPSMPQNAIASGCVDFILPAERIGPELARLATHPYLAKSAFENGTLQKFLRSLSTVATLDFKGFRNSAIARSILRRMAVCRVQDPDRYARELERNPLEANALREELLLPSSLFDDPDLFTMIRKKITPRLAAASPPDQPIRVWVPGCSSGEMIYSLAINRPPACPRWPVFHPGSGPRLAGTVASVLCQRQRRLSNRERDS